MPSHSNLRVRQPRFLDDVSVQRWSYDLQGVTADVGFFRLLGHLTIFIETTVVSALQARGCTRAREKHAKWQQRLRPRRGPLRSGPLSRNRLFE